MSSEAFMSLPREILRLIFLFSNNVKLAQASKELKHVLALTTSEKRKFAIGVFRELAHADEPSYRRTAEAHFGWLQLESWVDWDLLCWVRIEFYVQEAQDHFLAHLEADPTTQDIPQTMSNMATRLRTLLSRFPDLTASKAELGDPWPEGGSFIYEGASRERDFKLIFLPSHSHLFRRRREMLLVAWGDTDAVLSRPAVLADLCEDLYEQPEFEVIRFFPSQSDRITLTYNPWLMAGPWSQQRGDLLEFALWCSPWTGDQFVENPKGPVKQHFEIASKGLLRALRTTCVPALRLFGYLRTPSQHDFSPQLSRAVVANDWQRCNSNAWQTEWGHHIRFRTETKHLICCLEMIERYESPHPYWSIMEQMLLELRRYLPAQLGYEESIAELDWIVALHAWATKQDVESRKIFLNIGSHETLGAFFSKDGPFADWKPE